jgi:formylglycine-generating enzyme required for sulfatase activity
MRTALQACGFEVMITENADKHTIKTKVKEFTDRLATYDVGLFFYAGHGLEVDGINYLVPTDLQKGAQKADIPEECVPSHWIQERMAAAGQYDKTNIVILDACRNNPYRGWTRNIEADAWVMPKQVPTGLITCFAASQGETAADGDGNNGLYTSVLLKHLQTRGITIEEVFKRVRIELLQRGGQVPIENTKLTKNFYFVPGSGSTPTPLPTPDPRNSDYDGDGFTDNNDQCPVLKGTIRGCPDTDGDGVIDKYDKCMNERGTATYDGCPAPAAKSEPEPKPKYEPVVTKPTTTSDLPSSMVFVQGGNFMMGDTFGEGESNETKHSVTVSDFYIAKYETTFGEYDMFCNATGHKKPNDSGFGRGSRPVINISWHDAVAFCEWRSRETGRKYRLPTEAEWEFAARERGANLRFGNNSDNINADNANFNASEKYKKDYSSVGTFRGSTVGVTDIPSSKNALGLYHMSGNVWEWCSDWYDAYGTTLTNPMGAATGTYRVIRGGSWSGGSQECRATNRFSGAPTYTDHYLGFRVVSSSL